jgi:hypothetical protein
VGVTTSWNTVLDSNNTASNGDLDPSRKEQILEDRLLHVAVSDRTRQTILGQVTADPAQQEASLQQVAVKDRKRDPLALQPYLDRAPIADPQTALAAGLLFGSPEFQRR